MQEKWGTALSFLKDIAIGVIIWGFVITFVGEARVVPSGSMEPTIEIGNRLWTDKTWLWARKVGLNINPVQRGDILVFDPPFETESPFIKRVIGLPGDKIAVAHGKVYINDQPLDETYIKEAPNYIYGPVTVPEGKYFMMGDNRNNSHDSHAWGFLDGESIKSRAVFRFWPLSQFGKLAR